MIHVTFKEWFVEYFFIGNLNHLRWGGSLRGPKYHLLKFGDINAKVVVSEGAKMYFFQNSTRSKNIKTQAPIQLPLIYFL
jgi:hypothetical protein